MTQPTHDSAQTFAASAQARIMYNIYSSLDVSPSNRLSVCIALVNVLVTVYTSRRSLRLQLQQQLPLLPLQRTSFMSYRCSLCYLRVAFVCVSARSLV
jgi:hypothetical protein